MEGMFKYDSTITLAQILTLCFQVITIFISFIVARITLRNANRTVQFQRNQTIVDLVSRLISVVDPNIHGWEIMISGKYVTDEHLLLEKKLSLWLDTNKPIESKLLNDIFALRNDCKTLEKLNELRDCITTGTRNITSNGLK